MKHFFDHLELYLTLVGIALIFFAASMARRDEYWHVMAITALLVGVVHGAVFWLVRRQQQRIRQSLIGEIRPMLADQIKGRLTVLLAAAGDMRDRSGASSTTDEYHRAVTSAIQSAQDISATIDRLSLDSLRRWQRHYAIAPSERE